MKPKLRQSLFYKFERFLSKGGSSIFKTLFVIFIGAFTFILLMRYLMLFFFPELDYMGDFADHIWVTFLQMTAPGNMNQDTASPAWLKLTSVLAGFAGVVLLSMLIAFITSSLNSLLYDFRKGRGPVLENDHTVILGWNDRIVDVMKELILANESEQHSSIVILSDVNKEEMDDHIQKRIPDSLRTELITTSGDSANISELQRINITKAKSIIILAKCSENASAEIKVSSDIQAIKSILAIRACQEGESNIPVIAEIFTKEKRDIIDFFNDPHLIALDTWNIMGKLIMQTSLTSGLQLVYNEILSFDGGEIYFHKAPWKGIQFKELFSRFQDGVPIGIFGSEGLILRPPWDYQLADDDELLILAEDDSTIKFSPEPLFKPVVSSLANEKLVPDKKSILILGWHHVAEVFIEESSDYLPDGTSYDIMYDAPSKNLLDKFEMVKESYENFDVTFINESPLSREGLLKIDPNVYDIILVFNQRENADDPDAVDSDTLIILLLLRERFDSNADTKIITQVLNSDNQKLINQTDVDDFVISNKLITMILAQLSEEPKIKLLYDDIFSEEGSELYVKPAALYYESLPIDVRFIDIIGHVVQRDEICLGIRKGSQIKSIEENFGVRLNIDKQEVIRLEKDDYLVVLSEDEL